MNELDDLDPIVRAPDRYNGRPRTCISTIKKEQQAFELHIKALKQIISH